MDPAPRLLVLTTAAVWVTLGFAGFVAHRHPGRRALAAVLVFLGVAGIAVVRFDGAGGGYGFPTFVGVIFACLAAGTGAAVTRSMRSRGEPDEERPPGVDATSLPRKGQEHE